MKKINLIVAASLMLASNISFGQELPKSKVPSAVVNSFQKSFPKTHDVEWELNGDQYKVEFETGLSDDHNAWFDNAGKLVKHEQEISESKLPTEVLATIKSDFKGYKIDDVKKITVDNKVIYAVELDSLMAKNHDVKVTFDAAGKILAQTAD